jgi:hypothetical protein
MQNYEIDEIINLMKRYTPKKDFDGEIEEQDAAPAASGGGGGEAAEYPTVTKWESGVTRGLANQIGLTKWRDIVKVTRGKANTLL